MTICQQRLLFWGPKGGHNTQSHKKWIVKLRLTPVEAYTQRSLCCKKFSVAQMHPCSLI